MDNAQVKLRVVNWVSQSSLKSSRRFLEQNGFRVFELDGQNVRDAQSFFDESLKLFPFDPPLSGRLHWDAFQDSLWGGLADLGERHVAIVWTKAERMFESGLPDLFIVVDIIQNIASEIGTTEYGLSRPIDLVTFLVGEGDNFKTLTFQ